MGDLMDQGNQKSIFVQSGIHGNPMGSIGKSYIVPVPRNALVHNFKVDKIFLDELHAQAYRPLRNILFQDMLHNGKIRNFKMVFGYPAVFCTSFMLYALCDRRYAISPAYRLTLTAYRLPPYSIPYQSLRFAPLGKPPSMLTINNYNLPTANCNCLLFITKSHKVNP